MLIRAIRAENFMKFHRLAIDDLPGRGLIGIEGQNEGGKSISSVESSILELINWERDQCAVELDFDLAGEHFPGSYRIWREIDRYGTNFARLTTRAANGEWKEIASGLMQVQARLAEMIRFDFDDFTRSFFLAEKEFPRSPEAMRGYLDRMVGADVLVAVSGDVRQEIQGLEVEFGKIQAEIKRNVQQIEKYVPNIAKIPQVEKQRDEIVATLAELAETDRRLDASEREIEQSLKSREAQRDRLRSLPQKPTTRLKEGVRHLLEGYPSRPEGVLAESAKDLERIRSRLNEFEGLGTRFEGLLKAIDDAGSSVESKLTGGGDESLPARARALEAQQESAKRSRSRSATFGAVAFVFGVILCGVAAAILQEWVVPPEEWGDPSTGVFVGFGVGGLFLVVAIALWVRAGGRRQSIESARQQLSKLEQERAHLQSRLDALRGFGRDSVRMSEVDSALSSVDDDRVRQAVSEYRGQFEKVTSGQSLEDACNELAESEHRIIQRLRSTAKNHKDEREKAQETQKKESTRKDRAETEIREYQKQEGRKAGLEEQNRELKVSADAIREEIETRQLLIQLLDETIESIRHRAGPALGKTLRRLLPSLTGGRYRDLKITPEFKLQVFTSEKSDFLAQHELSGGTFEGLSLGFRLAFSQAFIRAVVRGPQFLFLDEPFKAMDAQRVHRTLRAMMRLSPELQQIFVVLPGIRSEDRELFDVIHKVTVGEHELGGPDRSRGLIATPSSRPRTFEPPRVPSPSSWDEPTESEPQHGLEAHEEPADRIAPARDASTEESGWLEASREEAESAEGAER
ncbi:MAG: hypothetical protein KDC38_08565 [Planctomycetes bacterium]|nr:hypothetical protein [Planctomycetota bacterium]